MDTCNCNSKATISTVSGVEKIHSSTCSKDTKWKWPKEEEPKPACDHIVGVYNDDGFVLEVEMSMVSKDSDWNEYDREEFVFERKYAHSHFYFCPKKGCGQSIDWDAIKKKLNLKKDE